MEIYDDVKISRYIKNMYDVSNVPTSYRFWYFKILNILLDIFKYKNVPPGLNEREIELNLLLTGHAVILAKPDGTLFNPITCITGIDEYYQPTKAVYANPIVNDTKVYNIHEDCEIIYNSKLHDYVFYIKADSSMQSFIGKYARLLADIESTIDIYTINSRLTSIPATDDQNVAQSLKAFFKKLTIGERAIVTDSNIIQQFRTVDYTKQSVDRINDWLVARDKVLEMMFRDLGVKMYNPKKAQVNENELESNNQLLLLQLDDMLDTRYEGCENVNKMYGTNMEPYINPRFNIEEYENTSEEPEEVLDNE